MRSLFSLLIIVFLGFSPLPAQSNFGPETAVGARAFAIGQTATLSFLDAVSVTINPASAANSRTINATIFYMVHPLSDASLYSGGIIIPVKKIGVFGFSTFYEGINNLPASDSDGQINGSFAFSSNHFLLTYARQILPRMQLGLNGKWIRQVMESDFLKNNFSENGYGLDAALQYYPDFAGTVLQGTGIGIAVENLFKPKIGESVYPREYRFILQNKYGVSEVMITLVLNYIFYDPDSFYESGIRAGVDFIWQPMHFDFGMEQNSWSLGMGVVWHPLTISYVLNRNKNMPSGENLFHGISLSGSL